MNPILAREFRLRFRDKRSFWLLFGLTILLCLTAAWIYSNAINRFTYAPSSGSYTSSPYASAPDATLQRESQTGRELFRFLALGNTLAWLLIAPALTATGLAKERERGLLESLWLSPFRVRFQVLGRLGSALCFLFVLQVATLPIYGIAVLLGGVSPADIALSGLIISGAALVGASFGLFCSARSYRSSSALGAAFIGIAIWSYWAIINAQNLRYGTTDWTNFALSFSHPVALLWLLLSPNDFAPRFGAAPPVSMPDALAFGLAFQLASSSLLLWSATRKAAKPLPDMKWSEGNTRLKKWKKSLDAAKLERQARLERERASQKVAGALLYELPVEKFVRFKDPLLSREVRGRFRLRQSGFLVSLGRFGIFLIGIGFWLAVLFNALDKTTHNGAGPTLLLGLLGFGTLAVGVMSSGAIVREREAGTWEGLHLSLLSPREVVRSKWLSPLVTFGYWSAPCWLLLPFSVDFGGLGAVLVLIASLGSVSAWGFFISSRAPHSAAATSWTLASLLVIFAGFPALAAILGIGMESSGYSETNSLHTQMLWQAWHPFVTIANLFDTQISGDGIKVEIVALNLFFNAISIAFLLFLVRARLKKSEA
ncbi:hypothetical protein B1R32_10473 [Abditibacterium utsteinense]|uniref:ABC-2 family transporter protein n=1 Tax=Abditibacterium utsteinense TaxID=1960156 RepID=A0A2S8SUW1_9BACT|nr:ABC transporter permease subunit [Abditibacterium utsteinense]PQV64580.1 hypothetical protein B1R32_10473 [Abditibacterium utsteinense]